MLSCLIHYQNKYFLLKKPWASLRFLGWMAFSSTERSAAEQRWERSADMALTLICCTMLGKIT